MSSRNNPFEELERMFERMSSQFEEASRSWGGGVPLAQWTGGDESMALDLVERDDAYEVTVDLPGFEREDVDVRVTDDVLRITAEREDTMEEEEDADYIRHERRHRRTSRSVRLPDVVDRDAVSATMQNGVLTVTIPRPASDESKQIEIE